MDAASNVRIVVLASTFTARKAAAGAATLSYIATDGSAGVEAGVVSVDTASGDVVQRFRIPTGGAASDVLFDAR